MSTPLPTLEAIAALAPMRVEGRDLSLVLAELNQRIEAAGIEFGENSFSTYSWSYEAGCPDTFRDHRWIEVSAVRGSNEGYYLHIRLVMRARFGAGSMPATYLISTAKTWTWESALLIAAATTRLLCDE
jgi:hypothetical protein